MIWFSVAAGGALGAVLRYWLSQVLQGVDWLPFPADPWVANVMGAFLLGAVWAILGEKIDALFPLRQFIGVGFCGALTTFSSFSLQTLHLLQDQRWGTAMWQIAGNLVSCLLAVWIATLIFKA